MRKPDLQTIYVDGWKGGMDTRQGLFADAFKTFRELTNCVISVNGNVISRPPARKYNVKLSGNAQGWLYNNGQWYTFAKEGDVVTHTGANAGLVTTLRFNPPEYTTTWTLINAFIFRGNPVAVIRHGYLGSTITSRIFYHTWDSKANQPTWVFDPYAPQSWSLGSWPVFAYNSGAGPTAGNFLDFTPSATLGAEKILSSRADGSLGFSAIGRSRVWNTRSADDIERTGAMYYFTMPSGGTARFTFPENYLDLIDVNKFAGYVVEKFSNNSWVKMTQTTGAVSSGQFKLTSFTKTWAPSYDVGQIQLAEAADTLVRIRCCVTPEVRIVTGGSFAPSNLSITGDGAITDFSMGVPYAGFTSTYSGKLGGSDVSTYYDVMNSASQALVQFKRFSLTINNTAVIGNAAVKLATVAINSGGAGYAIGDKLDIDGGTGGVTAITASGRFVRLTVSNVAAGVITAVTIDNPTQPHMIRGTTAVTSTRVTGAGVGATFNLTWDTNVAAVQVGLPYAAVVDTTNFQTVVTLAGTSFSTFASFNGGDGVTTNPATTWLVWNTPAADNGKSLTGNIILKAGKVVTFDATSILVSGGQVTYEGSTYDFAAGSRSILTGATEYIGIKVTAGTASVVTFTTLTSPDLYNTWILGQITSGGVYTQFKYSYVANTSWYAARHLENLTYWAGTGEAGFLNTASRNRAGDLITSVISVKNRMLICYPQSTQLWAFDPDPNNNTFVDRYDFGTTGPLALFYDQVMMDSQRAPRLFELTGFNYQALVDTNVGETLTDIGDMTFTSSAFWPWFGGFVAFGTLSNSDVYAGRAKLPSDSILHNSGTQYGFWILSFSKESQTSAWSWNVVPGITSVQWQSMTPIDSKLYFVAQDNEVYYLDGDLYEGFTDEAQNTVVNSRAITHWTHCGQPGTIKRFISIDMAKDGPLQISANFTPWLQVPSADWGPVFLDTTIGTPRVPFTGSGSAVSLDMNCSDPEGFELQMLDLKYVQAGSK